MLVAVIREPLMLDGRRFNRGDAVSDPEIIAKLQAKHSHHFMMAHHADPKPAEDVQGDEPQDAA